MHASFCFFLVVLSLPRKLVCQMGCSFLLKITITDRLVTSWNGTKVLFSTHVTVIHCTDNNNNNKKEKVRAKKLQ